MEVNLAEILKELTQDEQDDIFRMIFVQRPEDQLVTKQMEDSEKD